MTMGRFGFWLVLLTGIVPLSAFAGPLREVTPTVLEVEPVSDDLEQLTCRFTEDQIALLEKLNRSDRNHLVFLKRIIVPTNWGREESAYSPLPERYGLARAHEKVIVVYKPAQVFGAYTRGRLERWGPVSTGVKQSPTPGGVFHLNWKSKGHRSTVNNDWFLPWYFNFHNKRGHSFHEYELPGKPASHGCIRLLGRDARWLYEWGEQWIVAPNGRHVEREGTTVLIVGEYDHDRQPMWLSPEYLASGGALDLYDDGLKVTMAEVFLGETAGD